MKKLFYIMCSLALLFTACDKPEVGPDGPNNNPDDKPAGKGEFVLTSEAAETIDEAGGDITVRFTSTVDWAASLDVGTDVASLNIKSGSAEDNFVKVNVKPFAEKNASRTIKLTLKPDGLADVIVTITQNGAFEAFFNVTTEKLVVPVAGGEVSFAIETNTEFDVTTYDEFEEWAQFTIDGTNCKFTVSANPDFAEREAYVKFTVPAFQVPVLDDEGKETGETEDKAFRVYITQAGHVNQDWIAEIPAAIAAEATNYSYAILAGIPLLCNGTNVYVVNPASGEISTEPMDVGGNVFTSITNDDAGNILFEIGGDYTAPVQVLVIPASGGEPFVLLNWANPYYGYGLKKLTAKGDVTKQAVVTMFNGGAPDYSGVNACLYWNIGDGQAAWEQTTPGDESTWVTRPTGNIIPDHLKTYNCWDSYRCFFAPVGPRVSDGFVYSGYDSVYKFLYYNGIAWTEILSTPYTWENGVNSFKSINWGGEDYSVAIGMSYFPCWAISSDLWLMKGTGSTLESIATLKYSALTTEGLDADQSIHAFKPGATDVALTIDGDALVAFVVDGSLKVAAKYTFSK
ncbi:MAG: BACON domain-containing protein [Bacteroidales bacterium]|nr:BACON domain-containing protein [Bacteroidales bacterium]